jgi:flavin-dependent dehydrogenase
MPQALPYRISSSTFIFSDQEKNGPLSNIKTHTYKNIAPPTTTTSTSPVEVLILGAGPAGLSCANGLARLLHTCIILSSSQFRNDKSKHMHNVLTWEHRDSADFRSTAQKDLLSHYYTISFENDGTISSTEKIELEPSSKSAKNISVEVRKIVKLTKLVKGAEVEVELEVGRKK